MAKVLLMNPRRRRSRSRRRMTALQKLYFGGGRRRNEPARAHGRRRYARRRRNEPNTPYRARRRHNPVASATGGVMEVLKQSIVTTAGVQVNNLLGNFLFGTLLKMTGVKRSIGKVATAVLVPGLAGMAMPKYRTMLTLAGSSAVAHEASKALDKSVYPTLGQVGALLSSSDGQPAAAAPIGVTKMGYIPGRDYGPGGTFAERMPPQLRAYVERRAGMGMWNKSDTSAIYDAGPSVY